LLDIYIPIINKKKNEKNILTLINRTHSPDFNFTACIIIPLPSNLILLKTPSIEKIKKFLKTLLVRPRLIIKDSELNIFKQTIGLNQQILRSFHILDKNKILHLIHDKHIHDISNINDNNENINIDQYINKITNNFDLKNIKITHFIFLYSTK
jgi:hypothetical protein